ncbi:SRPBCC family protein [Azospirillum sp. ST 5-10]|uniref:SRPBCC family protein n=1 Tax=unclassified Azospirillum TaxID=2630922 RepID=UPI003F4A15FC
MDMTGEERIAAPRAAVYAALNDPEILRQCIPGCQSLEKTSDTAMTATVQLAVGPVKATFKGAVTLSDLDPPHGYTIRGEGKGGPAGHAKGGATVTLEEAEGGAVTVLRYAVKADVGGKLAQLGGRLIDSTARKLAGEFFTRFGALVGREPDAGGEAPAAGGPTAVAAATPSGRTTAGTLWNPRMLAVSAGGVLLLLFAALLLSR